MESLDIKQLIGEATEYDKKQSLEAKKPKSWCKSVSAFANTLGGALIFGIADNDEIVGRINLVDVIRGSMNKAELGYRIAEKHQGKGYGKKAIELVLGEALNIHKLHRIEAGSAIENIASQKILESSGFRKVGIYNKYIYVNGQWNDSVIYEILLS